jgi:hypothetical protein
VLYLEDTALGTINISTFKTAAVTLFGFFNKEDSNFFDVSPIHARRRMAGRGWDKYTERLAARQRRVAAVKEEARIAELEGALPELSQKWSKDREAPSEEDWISRSSTQATQSTSHGFVSPAAPTMRAPQHAVSTLSTSASRSSPPAAEPQRGSLLSAAAITWQPLVLPAYCEEEEEEEDIMAGLEGALPELPQKWSEDAGVRHREAPSEEDSISRSSPPAAELPRARQPLVLPAYCEEEEEEEAEEDDLEAALPELPQKWGGDAGVRLSRKDGPAQSVEKPPYREAHAPSEDSVSRSSTPASRSSTPATQSTAPISVHYLDSLSRSSTPMTRSSTPASLSSLQVCCMQAGQQQDATETLQKLCGILPITSKTSPSSASSMITMKSLRPGIDDDRALKKLAAATLSCLRNLKPRDGDNRVVVQARLQELGEWAVPGSTMQLFGSTACDLHANGADLDLTLIPTP